MSSGAKDWQCNAMARRHNEQPSKGSAVIGGAMETRSQAGRSDGEDKLRGAMAETRKAMRRLCMATTSYAEATEVR